MLAVLPFENLTGDAGQDYFSDGLTEEMITQLGRLDPQHLGLIARTSAMHYKNDRKELAEISKELGVQYVLEGSVRRDGGKVRITAELIQNERPDTFVVAGIRSRTEQPAGGAKRNRARDCARNKNYIAAGRGRRGAGFRGGTFAK